MEEQPRENQPADELVARLEAARERADRLSVEEQQALRELLPALGREQGGLRERIIRLLNPRGVRALSLSERQFRVKYFVTTQDNYRLLDTVGEDIFAEFDATHGYYVSLKITALG